MNIFSKKKLLMVKNKYCFTEKKKRLTAYISITKKPIQTTASTYKIKGHKSVCFLVCISSYISE